MTRLLAITQRVEIKAEYGERRDALDQRWTLFLQACGLIPVPVPNHTKAALDLVSSADLCGILLSGGNDIHADAPERDCMEYELAAWARKNKKPVLGVCRGMQLLLDLFKVPLQRINGHAGITHTLDNGRNVNSYHRFAAVGDASPFTVLSRTDDGCIEEIRHPQEYIHGIMWHPERMEPSNRDDIILFQRLFAEKRA
ncbi:MULTISPECIES: gamma-glutamyl-gamma-aminobutyrate hydrolase family protein [unclassified Haematospirillum]|uniref:gamma-glutamyl-gamma-aminobutyrate hydrolase family protein n=1 Tax=unclassified Haematospirillum TaxID=2622088 RepID=UPI00143B4D3C|nr:MULTISPECIES: gamma-glutamyl-gamma-aminobutyrate hydrolase family protein [unclassified Haematospirillum]NKD56075.1 C26 family cysteine hydrolase domain-containing family [Haematospirillum sp. H4890]NKD76128.1 C26 family cysteine hydrolase domain-containing family [Haematospirillum sp. H4485]NKD88676.1 C26 family cysteine hydrolase domain-containing family [Haematospirillum sp. 15-248]